MRTRQVIHLKRLLFLMALAWLMTSLPLAAQAVTGQKTFASPTAAANALVEAARSGDPQQLVPVLGPQAQDLVASGDAVADKQRLARLVKSYDAKHTFSIEAQGYEVLQLGPNDWPFPFPIVRDGLQWYFDSSRGSEEIINRRIGKNELGAIAVCEGYVAAQKEYAARGHDGLPAGIYAQKLASTTGKQDGLYWPVAAGKKQSPLGPAIAASEAEGY